MSERGRRRRIVVLGTAASNPYAGMAWMHMQITAGLRRLGHDVYYFETTSTWPYDPIRQSPVQDSEYAVPYLARLCESFGLGDRWAYRRSYSDKEWLGLSRSIAEDLLGHADTVFNVAGATRLAEEGLKVGRIVYIGTDPVFHELRFANGEASVQSLIDEHDDVVTYGENIGRPDCQIPALPRLRATMRQPVLLDLWAAGPASRHVFTTVGNWKQGGEIEFHGETYFWSKDHEFRKIIDLPGRVAEPIEFATALGQLSPRTGLCSLGTAGVLSTRTSSRRTRGPTVNTCVPHAASSRSPRTRTCGSGAAGSASGARATSRPAVR